MKKIFGLILLIILFSSTGFAMKLEQPVEIGKIWTDTGGFYGNGYVFENASYNNGEECVSTLGRKDKKSYSKGIARFGNDTNALYVHYDINNPSLNIDERDEKFGAENTSNTVGVPIWEHCTIYQIKNDGEISLYYVQVGYGSIGYDIIFGRRQDGVWVKYIDMRQIAKKYFGNNGIFCEKANVNGNTIIIKYTLYSNNARNAGEFRFKWDETAQWFGVEQVVYTSDNQEINNSQIGQAQTYYERAEKMRKDSQMRWRDDEIIAVYTQAIELNPNLADAYIGRSVIYYERGLTSNPEDMAKSKVDLNRAIEINPNSARAYNWRAYVNNNIADATRAIELDPQYLDAYWTRAELYSRLKNYDKAIADYTFVINSPNFRTRFMEHYDFEMMSDWVFWNDFNNRMAWLYWRRAHDYREKKDYDSAISDYRKALELSPRNDWIKSDLQYTINGKN